MVGTALERVLCPNDEDWFVFSERQGASLLAELPVAPEGSRLSLVWFDPTDRRRKEIAAPDAALLIRSLPAAAAGRYYLRVRSVEGGSGSYRIRIRPGAGGGCTDILEPNDTRATPRRVKPDVFYGDLAYCADDFYVVSPPAGKPFRIHVFGPGNPTVDVFDAETDSRLVADRLDTSLLGGGKVAVIAPDRHRGRDLLLRLAHPTQAGRSYSMYLGGEPGLGCGQAPVLLLDGEDRGRVSGTTLGQTSLQPRGVCGSAGPDATWKVEVHTLSRLQIAARAAHPVRIALEGEDCGGLMSCRPVPMSDTGILDVPEVLPGTYVITVTDMGLTAGSYELSAKLLPPVAQVTNDICSLATEVPLVAGAGRVSGTTLGATGIGQDCGQMLPTVYYRYDPQGADRVAVEVIADGPVVVSSTRGTCQTQLSCRAASSRHSFRQQVSPGIHTLAISSASGEAIDFVVNVETGNVPANDRCGAAQALTLPADVSGDTRWAENSSSFPLSQSCTGYWLDGNDTFFSVSLAAGQTIVATLAPEAGYDGALYVIGDCAAPVCLAGVDGAPKGGGETLRFTAPQAGTYRLVVDGAAGGGRYRLTVQ